MFKPTKKTLVTAITFLLIGIIGTTIVWVYAPSSSETFTISHGIYPSAFSYTIWEETPIYYSKNAYGRIDYEGTNKTEVYQSSINALTNGGTILLKEVQLPSDITYTNDVLTVVDYEGERTWYENGELALKIPLPFPEFVLSNGRQCYQCRPLYYNRKTYAPYLFYSAVNDTVKIKIRAFDHTIREWGTEYTLATGLSVDNHFAPSIGMTSDYKLLVFYGSHNTNQKYKVSINSEDESSWGSEQTLDSLGTGFTYPIVITEFGVKLHLIIRSDEYIWSKTGTVDGASWDALHTIASAATFLYLNPQKIGSNILLSGIKRIYPNTREDLYFAYSSDWGTTWKEADGTPISLPLDLTNWRIAEEDLQPADEEGYAFISTPSLDENNKPVFLYSHESKNGSTFYRKFKIAQYSTTLGDSGSWSFGDVTDIDGDILWTIPLETADYDGMYNTVLYLDTERNRPATWFVLQDDNSFRKLVRMSGESFKFETVTVDRRQIWTGARIYNLAYDTSVERWEVSATLTYDYNGTIIAILELYSENMYW